jgi:hypothetical protein
LYLTASAPAAPHEVAQAAQESIPEFLPLLDATAGEVVVYIDLNGNTLRYEVETVDASDVTTRVTMRDQDGQPLGQAAVRRDRRSDDPLARHAARTQASRSARPEPIESGGRRWEAILYEDRWVDEEIHYVRRSWVSSAAPVFGLIRMELAGDGRIEARLELRETLSPAN